MKTSILILIGLALTGFNPLLAQSSRRVYSPPDGSFTVELPEAPKFGRITMSRDDDLMFRRGGSGYAAYTIRPSSDAYQTILTIGVLQLSTPIDNREFDENTYTYIAIYGGDKEDSAFKKNEEVRVGGFYGREYVYEAGDGGIGRALFINAGKRAYFLIYHTKKEGELSSEVVARMFSTFRPLR